MKSDLPFGKYYVKEITTDEHYVLSDTKYPVVFEYAGQDTATVEIKVNDGKKSRMNLSMVLYQVRRLTRMEKHLRVLLSVSSKPKKQNLQRILHL